MSAYSFLGFLAAFTVALILACMLLRFALEVSA